MQPQFSVLYIVGKKMTEGTRQKVLLQALGVCLLQVN